jgi:glycosyltransferase involved in cell wall biosynthesis
MDNSLAIVIPAYKPNFLSKTLDSLSKQTDNNFTLYIGDDCSPDDLYGIIKQYEKKIKIAYRKFEENYGRKNLVSHWNRCLDMIENESWFIMFSDDDIMESNCVESFRKTITLTSHKYDVYHFNLKIIDQDDNLIHVPAFYPQDLSSMIFFQLLYENKIDAKMPDFIFNTAAFREKGGFVPFELAIRTDNATVIKCAYDKGIRTINDACVLWRSSGINISDSSEESNAGKVLKAYVDFFNWIRIFCRENKENEDVIIEDRIRVLVRGGISCIKYIGIREVIAKLYDSYDIRKHVFLSIWIFIVLIFTVYPIKLINKLLNIFRR